MSNELVKRISIKNKKEIYVNSASSNIIPKQYTTWKYNGTVKQIVKDIFYNNLDIYTKTEGKFMNYFTMGLKNLADNYFEGDVYEPFKRIADYLAFGNSKEEYIIDENAETYFNGLIQFIENCINNNEASDKTQYYVKINNNSYLVSSPSRRGSYTIDAAKHRSFSIREAVLSVLCFGKEATLEVRN